MLIKTFKVDNTTRQVQLKKLPITRINLALLYQCNRIPGSLIIAKHRHMISTDHQSIAMSFFPGGNQLQFTTRRQNPDLCRAMGFRHDHHRFSIASSPDTEGKCRIGFPVKDGFLPIRHMFNDRIRLFLNGENLADTRQTRWDDPFLRPDRAADGRWTVDAWAPLDGRVINGGVRVSF